jgi:hypothetical protein
MAWISDLTTVVRLWLDTGLNVQVTRDLKAALRGVQNKHGPHPSTSLTAVEEGGLPGERKPAPGEGRESRDSAAATWAEEWCLGR